MGVRRSPTPLDVEAITEAQDRRVCVVLDAVAALAFQGITPPVDATAEDVRAVREANMQLSQLAEQVRGIQAGTEGC